MLLLLQQLELGMVVGFVYLKAFERECTVHASHTPPEPPKPL